jgi:hypothetical protein
MKSKGIDDSSFCLNGAAVEFYCCDANDLLDIGKRPVLMDNETWMPRGCETRPLKDMGDVLQFIADARGNRTSRSTRMNMAGGGHEGSSRSHAALLLFLVQKNSRDNTVTSTCFTLIDLAGAERPAKTGEKRQGGMEAFQDLAKGNHSVGAQAYLINSELSMLRTAIVSAKNANRSSIKFSAGLATSMMKMIAGALTGNAMLGMIVTLSPSGANGWETWFSLEYGKDMACLRVPLQTQKPENASDALKKYDDLAKNSVSQLEAAFGGKYFGIRLGNAIHLSQFVVDLYNCGCGVEESKHGNAGGAFEKVVAAAGSSVAASRALQAGGNSGRLLTRQRKTAPSAAEKTPVTPKPEAEARLAQLSDMDRNAFQAMSALERAAFGAF